MKLIIIANKLPLTIKKKNGKHLIYPSAGGLTTGLDSLETKLEKHWIGWPGIYLNEGAEKTNINQELKALNYHPIYLSPEQIKNYYEGYSNSVIWPLSHYFFSNVRYKNEYWESYLEVNSLFCKKSLEVIEEDDIIWVQDYQLMLLPKMLRDQIPELNIGYFHHIPFPSYELFRNLPERSEILSGLLGADLLAFHTHSYMRHFMSAVYRVLKIDNQLDEIYIDDRIVDVDVFPMGINYNKYHDAILNKRIRNRAEKLKKAFGEYKLILSVERLDYSKGILMQLRSFECFLVNHPQYIGQVSLVMIVSPSRDKVDMYAELKDNIDKEVGSMNGKYATASWKPIHYFYRTWQFDELVALYNIADIGLVTPYRDGMNLVAKEFIASKRDGRGVLILSEMAGASIELSEALIVNPTNMKDIEESIIKALEMPLEEQRETLENMQAILASQHIGQWAKDFIDELMLVQEKNKVLREKVIGKSTFQAIQKKYQEAASRLIILDYDGTLSKLQSSPFKAQPTTEILDLLNKLTQDPKNRVVISSGRDKQTLENWFGNLPVGLSAEHGVFYKEGTEWHSRILKISWNEEILETMKYFVKKTPFSNLEIKETALVWHYRNVDIWLAELRLNQLVNSLIHLCSRHNLQIMKGNKIVEIKSSEFNKGVEAIRLMEQKEYDFILAIGDDTTDEEMFVVLPEDAISIKVGKMSVASKYTIPLQSQTIPFLHNMSE